MDDYSVTSLGESKNEWCARLVNTLTPSVIEGLKSIFDEAWNLCQENDEEDKYLMTFQTFLSRVPKWNSSIIKTERERICETSGCGYLEELITCVHVIQLKALTCVRVGQKQKKVDLDVPSADTFVHTVYTNVARKLYTNIYLFEKHISPLQIQKHNRELEIIIKECILNSVRDSMPVEAILRAYLDETDELGVDVKEEEVLIPKEEPEPVQEVKEEDSSVVSENVTPVVVKSDMVDSPVATPLPPTPEFFPVVASAAPTPPPSPAISGLVTDVGPQSLATMAQSSNVTKTPIGFSDIDKAVDIRGNEMNVTAPKTIERLEQIASVAAEKRKLEDDDEDDDDCLTIGDEVKLEMTDINDLNRASTHLNPPILEDVEILA
tara:strand:+ start:140 stop:1276 length:1137 start_codon:yes stop_codon:yes gene_type:complete